MEKCGGCKAEAKERIEIRESLALKITTQGGRVRTSRDIREVKRRNRNESVFTRPYGLRENAETAISCRGPGHARKKK